MLQYCNELDGYEDWYEQYQCDKHFSWIDELKEELDEFEKELDQQYELTGEWNWDLDEKCDEIRELVG